MDSVQVNVAALANILNAMVSLVNENENLRQQRAKLVEAINGSSGQQTEAAPVNSTEEPLHGQAGEGEAKG